MNRSLLTTSFLPFCRRACSHLPFPGGGHANSGIRHPCPHPHRKAAEWQAASVDFPSCAQRPEAGAWKVQVSCCCRGAVQVCSTAVDVVQALSKALPCSDQLLVFAGHLLPVADPAWSTTSRHLPRTGQAGASPAHSLHPSPPLSGAPRLAPCCAMSCSVRLCYAVHCNAMQRCNAPCSVMLRCACPHASLSVHATIQPSLPPAIGACLTGTTRTLSAR